MDEASFTKKLKTRSDRIIEINLDKKWNPFYLTNFAWAPHFLYHLLNIPVGYSKIPMCYRLSCKHAVNAPVVVPLFWHVHAGSTATMPGNGLLNYCENWITIAGCRRRPSNSPRMQSNHVRWPFLFAWSVDIVFKTIVTQVNPSIGLCLFDFQLKHAKMVQYHYY